MLIESQITALTIGLPWRSTFLWFGYLHFKLWVDLNGIFGTINNFTLQIGLEFDKKCAIPRNTY